MLWKLQRAKFDFDVDEYHPEHHVQIQFPIATTERKGFRPSATLLQTSAEHLLLRLLNSSLLAISKSLLSLHLQRQACQWQSA